LTSSAVEEEEHSLKASGRAIEFLRQGLKRPPGRVYPCDCVSGSGLDRHGDIAISSAASDHERDCPLKLRIIGYGKELVKDLTPP